MRKARLMELLRSTDSERSRLLIENMDLKREIIKLKGKMNEITKCLQILNSFLLFLEKN